MRFARALVIVALLLGVPSAIIGNESALIWLDVGFCLVLAVILFVLGVKGCPPHPGRGAPAAPRGRTRDRLLILAAVVAVLSPAAKFIADLGEAVLPVAHKERECKAAPVEPPSEESSRS
jgi:hypothetical protein